MAYPWYEWLPAAHLTLEQGDLIQYCPIVRLPESFKPGVEQEVDVQETVVDEFNVVVMSQSCDLTHEGKITNVLVCPYYFFRQYVAEKARDSGNSLTTKAVTAYYEELRKGQQPNYHLLQQPGPPFQEEDSLVVDFRNVYAVHFSFLRQYVTTLPQRPRLLAPYREHLSQAFARFFMRVGLPQDLPKLTPEQAAAYTTR